MSAEMWLPSVAGRPMGLVLPLTSEVKFEELAHAMAHLNRYAGHAETPVSVGLHTLIVLAAVPMDSVSILAKPYALLHDAHETRTGEIPSPTKEALRVVAAELFGDTGPYMIDRVRGELEARHDAAIHAAAGLPLPDADMDRLVKQADLVALATERRDFLRSGSRAWDIDRLGIRPAPRRVRWRPPVRVAGELMAAFRTWLPVFQTLPAQVRP